MAPPPLLQYHQPTQPPQSLPPPRTGFLLDASLLISILTGVGTALLCSSLAIPSADSRYELIVAIAWLCIALAILVLEVSAYYLRSVTASFILALAYILLTVFLLRIVFIQPGGISSREFPVMMTLMTTPISLCIIAAVAHLIWSRRLYHWKRFTRDPVV